MNRANTDLICDSCSYRFTEDDGELESVLTIWGDDPTGSEAGTVVCCPHCGTDLVVVELVVRTFLVHTQAATAVVGRLNML